MTKASDTKPRTALRLVRPDDALPPVPSESPTAPAAAAPKPRSALGKALTAYADAIDRDIKLLLEL